MSLHREGASPSQSTGFLGPLRNLRDECQKLQERLSQSFTSDPHYNSFVEMAGFNRSQWRPDSTPSVQELLKGAPLNTKASVGLALDGLKVQDMVIGGPAHRSRSLALGDQIVGVDGAVTSAASVLTALIGNDTVGSTVELAVESPTGDVSTVTLRRADSAQIAAKRQLSVFFKKVQSVAAQQFIGAELATEAEKCAQIFSSLQIVQGEVAAVDVTAERSRRQQQATESLAWLQDMAVALDTVEARMLEQLIDVNEGLEQRDSQIDQQRRDMAMLQVDHAKAVSSLKLEYEELFESLNGEMVYSCSWVIESVSVSRLHVCVRMSAHFCMNIHVHIFENIAGQERRLDRKVLWPPPEAGHGVDQDDPRA